MATNRVPYRFVCRTCRKRAYDSRKHARSAAHAAHPGDHLAAYRCPHHTGVWHVGHLTPGDRDRDGRLRQSRSRQTVAASGFPGPTASACPTPFKILPPTRTTPRRKAPTVHQDLTSWRPFACYDSRSSSWTTCESSTGHAIGGTEFSAAWPKHGRTRGGHASTPTPARQQCASTGKPSRLLGDAPLAAATMLPTPQARDGVRGTSGTPAARRVAGMQVNLPDVTSAVIQVLPTPTAHDGTSNASGAAGRQGGPTLLDRVRPLRASAAINPDDAEDQARTSCRWGSPQAGKISGNRTGRPLANDVRLLPTPRARDGRGRDPNPRGGDLNEAVALLPTPRAGMGGPCTGSPKKARLEQEIALLPITVTRTASCDPITAGASQRQDRDNLWPLPPTRASGRPDTIPAGTPCAPQNR